MFREIYTSRSEKMTKKNLRLKTSYLKRFETLDNVKKSSTVHNRQTYLFYRIKYSKKKLILIIFYT